MSIFNKSGIFKGGKQSDGGLRDEHDIYRGREENGCYYTPNEIFGGHKDSDGNVYNASGTWVAKVDENGDIFDTHGVYIGHTDD